MSSSSYAFARTFADDALLLAYIARTLPTASSIIDTQTGVSIVFSSALTAPQQTTLTALVAAYPDLISGAVDQVQLSVFNVSTLPLLAAGVYTGLWEDASRFSSLTVSVLTNQASAAQGLVLQFGNNSQQVDITKTYTVAASVATIQSLPVVGRWVRVVYTNGATAQTSFNLQLKYSLCPVNTVADGLSSIDDTSSATLSRALTMARTDVGTYTHVRADEDKRIRVRTSAESAVFSTDGYVPIVQATYTYSINSDTNSTALVTGGSVTQSTSCALVSTSAAAASSATLSSRRYVGCGAGRGVRVLVSVAFAAGAAGSVQIAGIGTSENGLFVGYNGTAFGVLVRSNSVDTWTAATAFNVDRLNGAGASGITLDPTKGNVYSITYDSTGFGGVSFSIASCPAASAPEPVTAHRIAFGNTVTVVGVRNFAGPLITQVRNTTNTTALSARVASLSAFTDGVPRFVGALRCSDVTKTVQGAVMFPLMTISNKTSFQSITNCLSVYLRQLTTGCDGSKGNVIVTLYDNCTLTDAAFADISTSNSTVQVDTAATSFTGGTALLSFVIFNKGDQSIDLSTYDLSVSPGSSITVAAKCSTTSVSNVVSLALAWYEDV
jgi:hypothetical protein